MWRWVWEGETGPCRQVLSLWVSGTHTTLALACRSVWPTSGGNISKISRHRLAFLWIPKCMCQSPRTLCRRVYTHISFGTKQPWASFASLSTSFLTCKMALMENICLVRFLRGLNDQNVHTVLHIVLRTERAFYKCGLMLFLIRSFRGLVPGKNYLYTSTCF